MKKGIIELIINFLIGFLIFVFLTNGIESLLVVLNGGRINFVYLFNYNFINLLNIYLIGFTVFFCVLYTYKLFIVKKVNSKLENYRKVYQVYE